jgi:hypothetical protein
MKRVFAITILLFFGIHFGSLAQRIDSLVTIYNNNTIHRFGNRFIKGNQILYFGDLTREFRTPVTGMLYLKARRRLLVARICSFATLGVVIYSLFHINSTRSSVEYAVATGVMGYTGAYFQSSSSKLLDQAIWERNRALIFGPGY